MSQRRTGPRVVLLGSGIAAAVTVALGFWFGIPLVRARLAVHELETGEAAEREEAARLLGLLAQRSTAPALVCALVDEAKNVREAATESLLTIEGVVHGIGFFFEGSYEHVG